jgi:L-lysine exporter family protein LysE/ArgO
MFIQYIIASFVLGIIVAIPPGSVTVVACQRAIQIGFKNSIFFTLGSSLSDIFYLMLVYFGTATVISSNKLFQIILWFVSGTILIILGLLSIISIRRKNSDESIVKFQTSKISTFISGILITLTNPVTIVGWLAIGGNFFLLWNERYPDSKHLGLLSIGLIMFGVLIWFIPLTYIVSRLKKLLSERLKNLFIVIANIFLILFGMFAFYESVRTLFKV